MPAAHPRHSSAKGSPGSAGPLAWARARLSRGPARGEASRIAGAFALATAALALVPFIDAGGGAPPLPPGSAPDFTVDTAGGGAYALASDLGSRPILLEFMHPDCSHCRATAPALATAYSEYGGRVRFVSVAIRLGGFPEPTVASVAAFAQDYGHTWTYGVDRGTTARDAYHVTGTPLFVFIRGNGTAASTWPGEIPLDSLRAELAALAGG